MHQSIRLYCFSPPVMLATFMIEISFAIYILWRYQMNTVSRLVVAILFFLAFFQGAEYMLCGAGVSAGTWSKLGYGAITMLPPLGIHLSLAIAKKQNKTLLGLSYVSAAIFILYFVFYSGGITGQTCYANYVVFEGSSAFAGWMYGLYYYGWLLTAVWLSLKNGRGKVKAPLRSLALGYSSFIVPTTLVNTVDPSTMAAIPSIMCGFAVILAFVLTYRVAPETMRSKHSYAVLRNKMPF